jgi:hypothetical protein
MLVHDVEQRTPEWFALRRGIPTASQFCKIITSRGQASTQADAYRRTLLAERELGTNMGSFGGTIWTERGNALEPEAVRCYEGRMQTETIKVGFVTDRDRTIGCSPDRLVGADGLLEVKCPAPQTQAKYLRARRVDMRYYPQIQGQLLITGRQWVDFFSYHPDQRHLCVRVFRDKGYLAQLAELLQDFLSKMHHQRNRQ